MIVVELFRSLSFLFDFISFHDYHRATRDFLHFPLYLVSGVAALEVGGERQFAFTLDVDDADGDAVFLLAFQHDGFLWADAE